MTETIETERLILRLFQRDDLPHMQRYATRPAFYRYLPIVEQTPESVAAFLEVRIAVQESPLGTRITPSPPNSRTSDTLSAA
jgi:RimJ/RimL family protein N-acetyltransferase